MDRAGFHRVFLLLVEGPAVTVPRGVGGVKGVGYAARGIHHVISHMSTTVAPTRRMAQRIIRQLPPRDLHVAATFLRFLEPAEEWEATEEILADKRAVRQIERSRAALRAGRLNEFVEWKPKRR